MLIASSSLVASASVAAFCSQDFTLQQYRMTIVLLFRRYRTTLLRQFEKLYRLHLSKSCGRLQVLCSREEIACPDSYL